MSEKHYFQRVKEQSETRFWINNVTEKEAHWAIDEGAVGCTQNPSYVYKMMNHPDMQEKVEALIKKYVGEESDANEILIKIQRDLVKDIAAVFLDQYETSQGRSGYVSIQGDPFHEDADTIIKHALFNRQAGPNIMAKVPVTEEGLKAIEVLAAQGVPINATEVMSVRQALDVCEVYERATHGMKNKAPIYYSHITGILDEYLKKVVETEKIEISADTLWHAGICAAKKTYWLCRQKNKEVGFIGGGARGLHHFTEMVGADANITINWQGTADKLIAENPMVVQRFFMPTPDHVVDELCTKLPDFRKAYFVEAIKPSEYEDFGPVVLFRSSFEDAWSKALDKIRSYQ
ncbi:transaldolase family protein [Dielma fastidiosa]|uniref:transaldolase family protein n=1 Tax=Dielma fastidiosa TaxID=1034346 RepID=UPI000D7A386C|nr:transaldolase family protein [Dielma fastidiosa]MBS6168897.1 hypothetical protein [Bacillota bacterium]PWM57875.1 MAG: hypothetical protein DBX92_08975 [Dielma fastidiosa]